MPTASAVTTVNWNHRTGDRRETKRKADFPCPQRGTPAMAHIRTEAQRSRVRGGAQPERTKVQASSTGAHRRVRSDHA